MKKQLFSVLLFLFATTSFAGSDWNYHIFPENLSLANPQVCLSFISEPYEANRPGDVICQVDYELTDIEILESEEGRYLYAFDTVDVTTGLLGVILVS